MQKNVLLVSDGKDPIQEYVLTVLANTLQQYSSKAYLHPNYTLGDDLSQMITERSITHVIVNDFIIPPDRLQGIIGKCRNVKFFIRDVNTHKEFHNSQIFNLVKIYVLLGVKVLTRTSLIYDFRQNLGSMGLNKNLVCWAPDVYLLPCQNFYREIEDFKNPLRIGHYNRHGLPSENTTYQYLGCSDFSVKYQLPLEFRVLSVNQLTPWEEFAMLSCTQKKNFPDSKITLHENLTLDQLWEQIVDLDILLHVSKTDTYFIDFMAITSDIPIITSRDNLVLGKYTACKHSLCMSDLSLKLEKIYQESYCQKKWRLFRQKLNLIQHAKRAEKIWLKLLNT